MSAKTCTQAYTVLAQAEGVGVEPSAWFEGESFRALETAEDRLLVDLNSGALSREDYARYLLYRWFEPDRVPARYQVPEGVAAPELNVVLLDVISMMDTLDPAVAQELNDYLTTVLGGQESVPFTPEEDQALTEQFWAEAQDMRLDQGDDPAPTPEPEPVAEPEPTTEPAPTTGPEPSTDPATVWRGLTSVAPTGLTGVLADPAAPLTYSWCSEDVGTRLVPRVLTASTSAQLPCHLVTPKVVFHYTTSDRDPTHGVDPDDDVDMTLLHGASGGGPDGVPDEINAIAAAYFQAGVTYRSLGFEPIGRVDVLVADIPAALSVPKVGLVYVSKDTKTRSSVYTVRHELFHQYQYRYANLVQVGADYASLSASNTTTAWWLEATAEWGAHRAEVGAEGSPATSSWFRGASGIYSRLLEHHLGHPAEALTRFLPGAASRRQPQYGSFLFAEYLDQLYGPQIIAETWKAQEDESTRAIDAIAHVVQDEYGTDLSTVVQAYHRANYTIDTTDSVGTLTYTDRQRSAWADRLAETDRRPDHASLTLQPDRLVRASGSVEAGGAYYLDLDVPTYAPEGVTFSVTIDATSGQQEDLTAQIVYFGNYPNLCYPRAGRELAVTPGHAEQVTTLSPSCPGATLIISNNDAQSISAGVGRGAVGFNYTIATRANTTETVVEYGYPLRHHRVNFGADLRRTLSPSVDPTATVSIDLGNSITEGRRAMGLHIVSWDSTARASDTLVVNGAPVELAVGRAASTSDGRVLWVYGPRWRSIAVTTYLLPAGALHDGVNTFELPVSDGLYIYGAYVSSVDAEGPEPEPDPDPDPGPVAS
ncbi:hypothetical protein ACTHAM_003025 [Cellulomonas soli]|uniref:hypothetical protein n=1 Tax=Cellulomonas soli TaxID=931535 RepID=UPI003F83676D